MRLAGEAELHQRGKQRRQATADRRERSAQHPRLGATDAQQVVYRVDLAGQRPATALQFPVSRTGVPRSDQRQRRRAERDETLAHPPGHGPAAEEHGHQAQAADPDDYRRGAGDDVLEGRLGLDHGRPSARHTV